MFSKILTLALSSAVLVLCGCVSSSDHESLVRRYRLMEIEKNNAQHARAALQKDLDVAKTQTLDLEGRLADTRDGQRDRASEIKDLRAQLTKAQRRAANLDQKIERIRSLVGDGRIETKEQREQLALELQTDSNTAPVPEAAGTSH